MPQAADQNNDVEVTSPAPGSPESSSWTWQVALVVVVLVLASFAFAYLLIANGVAPQLTAGITLLIVVGVVINVSPSKSGNPLGRRLARAVSTFLNGENGQK